MSFFHTRLYVLIAMLLPVLAGCQTYTGSLGLINSTITAAKHGQDCRSQYGFGDVPDLTGTQAIRSGGITNLRSLEYRVNTFLGVGSECVIAHGE
ncbi:MAG TPA: hypothetical protein VK901_08920 [Nitrospiraceae bacterium]|nr:hypothetical protein [Nitrospiraceae bacterium]